MKIVRSLLPFWLFTLIFKFGAGLHYTLLPALGARILPVWLIGFIIGGGSLLQLILDVPAGITLDRFGYIRVMRLSTLAFVFAGLVLTFGLNPITYVVSIILATIGWLFFGPGANAYLLVKAPRAEAGRYLGFFHAILSLGIVLATITLIYVISSSEIIIGLIIAVLLLLALLAVHSTPRENESVHQEKKLVRQSYYVKRHFINRVLKAMRKLNPAATLLALQSLAGSMFYASIWFSVPIILSQNYNRALSFGMSMFDLSVVILGTYLGKLADNISKRIMILAGLLLFAVAGSFTGLNLNIWFIVLGFLTTTGDEMSSVALWSWLDHLDSKHNEDGLINGVITLFDDIGWAVGPMLAGLLYTQLGATWTIVLASGPIFILWILAFFMTLKTLPAKTPLLERQPIRLRHKR